MMLNHVGDFNPPSYEHLVTALECCFPKSNSLKCKEFSEKFNNLPTDVNPYFKINYQFFAQCYSGNDFILLNETNIINCSGCLLDSRCYPLGYRKSGEYCAENNSFVLQRERSNFCENNFECISNACVGSECIDLNLWQQFLGWFNDLLNKE